MKKKYYLEREGLLTEKEISLNFEELKQSFFELFTYFKRKNSFEIAFRGKVVRNRWGDIKKEIPLTLAPSPSIFFLHNLGDKEKCNIDDYYTTYTEQELFTVIEILYEHISEYDIEEDIIKNEELREEFSTHINNLLKFYKDGYYLEPKIGFIMEIPNESLKNLLQEDVSEILDHDTIVKFQTALKQYYRYNSNFKESLEVKKKSIALLVDILENVREDLKVVLNEEFEVNKNVHDKMIFNVVNDFNIRHDNQRQMTDYSKEIWYDWMAHYYSSVIITYYKLLKERKE